MQGEDLATRLLHHALDPLYTQLSGVYLLLEVGPVGLLRNMGSLY